MSTLAKLVVELGLDSSQFSSGIQSAQKQASGLGTVLQTAAGTAIGFMGAMAGTAAIGTAFAFVKDSAIGMNATLETSTLQFQTLMGSADQATEHVKGLFQFAKETPFETQPIIDASQHLQVFGGSVLNTRDYLVLFGDAAAATTKPMEQITFWSGRLYAALQAGKPIEGVLNPLLEMGVIGPNVVVQLEAMQKAGASASEMWNFFREDVTKFSGAMKLQAGTWQGLTSSISDSAKMLAATAFKPLFDSGKKALEGILNLLGRLEASGAAQRFADGLQFVIAVLEKFGSQIIGYGKAAFAWGQNIANQFAAGIAAAINTVVAVLRQIGSVIASWLRPGSPPKITPELDQWGKDAGTVYIEGWAQADFSAFDDLSRSIESSLKGLVDTGKFDQRGVIPTLLAGRQGISAGLSEIAKLGEVSQATFDGIVASLGPAGGAVSGLVRAYFDLSAATRRLEAAQEELNRTTQKYSDMLAPLNAQMQQLQDQAQHIRNLQRIEELNEILADGESTQLEKDLASNELQQIALQEQIDGIETQRDAEIAAAQAKVDAAAKEESAAQARIDQQQAMLDATNSTNALIAEQASLLESLAKSAASGGGGAGLPKIEPPSMGDVPNPLDAISKSAEDAAKRIDEINTEATAFVTNIQNQANTLVASVQSILQPIITFGEQASAVLIGIGVRFAVFSVLTTVVGWVTSLSGAWAALTAALSGSSGIIGGIVALLGGPITIAIGAIAIAVGTFAAAWAGNWFGIRETFAGVVSALTPLWETLQAKIGTAVQNLIPVWEALQVTFSKVGPVFAVVGGIIVTIAESIIGLIGGALPGVFYAAAGIIQSFLGVVNLIADVVSGVVTLVVQLLTGDFAGAWMTIKTLVSNIVVDVLQVIGGLLQGVFGIIGALVSGVVEFFKTLYNVIVGHSIIPDLVNDVITTISTLPGTIVGFISGMVLDVIAQFTTMKDDTIAKVKSTFEDVVKTIEDKITTITTTAKSVGAAIVQGIQDGISNLWSRFTGWIQDRINEIPQAVRDVLGIHSPSTVFAEIGMQSVAGIQAGWDKLMPALQAALGLDMAKLSEKLQKGVQDWLKHISEMFKSQASLARSIYNTFGFLRDFENATKSQELQDAQNKYNNSREKLLSINEQLAENEFKMRALAAETALTTEEHNKRANELAQERNALLNEQAHATNDIRDASIAQDQAQLRANQQQAQLALLADNVRKQYQALENQVNQLSQTDAKAALDTYNLRSKQIQELSELQKQLITTSDPTERSALETQIRLLQATQGLETQAAQTEINLYARDAVLGMEEIVRLINEAFQRAGISADIRLRTT